MATATPPLAVPSSFVRTTPVTPATSMNCCACARPFCPTVASSTMSTSCGAPGTARAATRRILSSSCIRFWRGMQAPGGVDEDRAAKPRALPDDDGVEHDRRRIGAFLRADHLDARAVGPDLQLIDRRRTKRVGRADERRCPRDFARLASLPTVVVLPVPLTPTMRTTCGVPCRRRAARRRRRCARISWLHQLAQALAASRARC